MVRTSTPALSPSGAAQSELYTESLGEEEQFYSSIQAALNKNIKDPEEDTIRFILNYSRFLQERRK